MKAKRPNWLSRQLLPELQTDLSAYFLKMVLLALPCSLYLLEQGLSPLRIGLAISLGYIIIGLVVSRTDPNLPPDA